MKVVIAPDSYKGSLSSVDVAQTIAKAIHDLKSSVTVIKKPMADGGEGTLATLQSVIDGKVINVTCTGPRGDKIETTYSITKDDIAIIEYALIAGLPLLDEKDRHPDFTTSYGLGEVILDAINRGCKSIIIGLGGSATNDCGLGMLLALGMTAFDNEGKPVGKYGKDVKNIHSVCFKKLDKRIENIKLHVARDVTNPLCGKSGATYVYGTQKGLKDDELKQVDHAIYSFAQKINETIIHHEGSGAAGGLGFALKAIGAKLSPGAKLIAHYLQLEGAIAQADLIITGEGRSDQQTLYGKAPAYVAHLAKKYKKRIILLSGSLKQAHLDHLRQNFTGCFSIQTEPLPLDKSIELSEQQLYDKTKLIIQFILNMNKCE